jgi:predicted membrane protein
MSAGRLRVVMIALFAAAAILTAISNDGPLFAAAFVCFVAGVLFFFRWRRVLRGSVFAREEKTPGENG